MTEKAKVAAAKVGGVYRVVQRATTIEQVKATYGYAEKEVDEVRKKVQRELCQTKS